MMSVQGPLTDNRPISKAPKCRAGKDFQARYAINKKLMLLYTLKPDSSITKKFPRFKPFERPSFRGLPVLWHPDYDPFDMHLLEEIHDRHCQMVHLAGRNADMVRLDFSAGIQADAIQSLMEQLQRMARQKGTKIHFVCQAELALSDAENHWHAVIWFDQSKMELPALANRHWLKLQPGQRIIWTRNQGQPGRFQIGKNESSFRAGFRAASYLAKSSQPPKEMPGKKNRIISRMDQKIEGGPSPECPYLEKYSQDYREEINA